MEGLNNIGQLTSFVPYFPFLLLCFSALQHYFQSSFVKLLSHIALPSRCIGFFFSGVVGHFFFMKYSHCGWCRIPSPVVSFFSL
jgi:hypothetical protein